MHKTEIIGLALVLLGVHDKIVTVSAVLVRGPWKKADSGTDRDRVRPRSELDSAAIRDSQNLRKDHMNVAEIKCMNSSITKKT